VCVPDVIGGLCGGKVQKKKMETKQFIGSHAKVILMRKFFEHAASARA
jgi:hypothetical protein